MRDTPDWKARNGRQLCCYLARGINALIFSIACAPASAGLFLGPTGITFDGETVSQQIAFLGPWARVLSVSPRGAEFTDPMVALAAIPRLPDPEAPSAEQPYLVKIGPGIYDLGPVALQMQPHVAIVGGGQEATIIRGNGDDDGAVVLGADHALLRHLSVETTGEGGGIGIHNYGTSPLIMDVTATANAGNYENIAIYNRQSDAVLTRVTARAFASGSNKAVAIQNQEGAPTLRQVKVYANGGVPTGVFNDQSAPLIMNLTGKSSTAEFSTHSIIRSDNGSTPTLLDIDLKAFGGNPTAIETSGGSSVTMTNVRAQVTHVMPNGSGIAIINGGGGHQIMTNVQVIAVAQACCDLEGIRNGITSVEMTNVTVTTSGGSDNWGIYNYKSNVVMTNVQVTAEDGAATGRGIYNDNTSAIMNNVTVHAAGSVDHNWGIYNESSSTLLMQGVNATAAGNQSYGMYSIGSAPVVRGSYFEGETGGLNGITLDTRISDTKIVNFYYSDASTSHQCRNVYDENQNDLGC